MPNMNQHQSAQGETPMCRVYEAGMAGRPGYRLRVMVCDGGEARLNEDLVSGRKLFRLGRLLLETRDQDLARSLARSPSSLHYA